MPDPVLKALVISCTLKASPAQSNTEALAKVVTDEMAKAGVASQMIRLADLNIKPGVTSNEGDGDDWPQVLDALKAADILIVATPTWMGQASSFCQRMMERLDALFEDMAEDGRPVPFDKAAGVVVTGNEDGAHHIIGTVCQGLIDLGFTVPGQAWTYWHKGPGAGPDYLDDQEGHDWSDAVGRNAARNLVAVARVLKTHPLPKPEKA